MSYTALSSRRTPALIRRSDPECYQIALIRSGRQSLEQAGQRGVIDAGDLVLYDSSRPFHAVVPPCRPRAESLLLQFPRSLLPLPERQVAELLAVPLPGRCGLGRLLSAFLGGVAAEEPTYTVHDRQQLQGIAIDLVAATLAQHLGRHTCTPQESRCQALFQEIDSYIDQHLADPGLGPARVAAAHHISVRQLHRVFQQRHLTVAGLIRRKRLERCRRDLADPALRSVTIHAIAARWGFPEPAAFSRVFRGATGCSPSEYRAACFNSTPSPRQRASF